MLPAAPRAWERQREVSTGIPGAHSCWKGSLQWTEGLTAAFGSSPSTLRATLAQSSQAASGSVHPTEHGKSWEDWKGRVGRKAGKEGWEGCTGTPAPVPALFSLQHKGMSLGQHLVLGQAGLHQNEGME